MKTTIDIVIKREWKSRSASRLYASRITVLSYRFSSSFPVLLFFAGDSPTHHSEPRPLSRECLCFPVSSASRMKTRLAIAIAIKRALLKCPRERREFGEYTLYLRAAVWSDFSRIFELFFSRSPFPIAAQWKVIQVFNDRWLNESRQRLSFATFVKVPVR